MPSFLCTCLRFRTRWRGSRTYSNFLGTICQPMPSLCLLCLGRCCRELCYRLGSRWFWWHCCGPRKSGSLTSCPCWSTNRSTSAGVELTRAAPHVEVPSRPRDPPTLRVEVVQCLVRKAGFSKAVARVAAADLRHSNTALYQSKWSRFQGWCNRRGIDPGKGSEVWSKEESSLYINVLEMMAVS